MPHRSHPLHQRWLRRRARLRRLLRRLPRRANIARYPVIKWFAEAARRRPYLWSFKRAQILPALYAGSVLSLMPTYGLQVLIGFAAAIVLRANLTVMIALQLVTNPLTIGPIYYATHGLGQWLITRSGVGAGASEFGTAVNALVVGGVVAGLALALAADLAWRLLAWEARVFSERWRAMRAHHQPPGDSASQRPKSS